MSSAFFADAVAGNVLFRLPHKSVCDDTGAAGAGVGAHLLGRNGAYVVRLKVLLGFSFATE